MTRFQPVEIIRTLSRNRVEYVLIGGIAATLHGSNLRTADVDICPSRTRENLERLTQALTEMEAAIRVAGLASGVPFSRDATFLSQVEILNLRTRFGDFDLSFLPSGTRGYEDLAKRKIVFDLDGLGVPTASLPDIIRSKEAAGRQKDLQHLPALRILLEQKKSPVDQGEGDPES